MRVCLKVLLALVAVIAAALVTMPWWLGLAARPLAKSFGVRFERYERVGYSRFRLTHLRIERPAVTIEAAQVEAAMPLAWWWLSLRGGAALAVDHWRVAATAHESAAPAVVTGVPSLERRLQEVAARLDHWISHAELRDGAVTWPRGELSLARADWEGRTLTVQGLGLYGRTLAGTVTAKADGTWAVRVADAALGAELEAAGQGATIEGRARWLDQPAALTARFPANGWMPEEVRLDADDWNIPADRLNLGARYDRVRGGARLDWRERAFTLGVTLTASPQAGTDVPPLELKASAQGDTRVVTLDALHIDAPFAEAELSAPVSYRFGAGLEGGPAKLRVHADLGRQPWFDLAGQARGDVEVDKVGTGARLDFRLEGEDLQRGKLLAKRATVRGVLRWPRLELAEADVQLDRGDRFTAHGAVDLEAHRVDGAVHAEFGSALVGAWLPAGTNWLRAVIDADVSGPWDAPTHQGRLAVEHAHFGPLKMFDVAGDWQGRGRAAEAVHLAVSNDGASLEAAGRVTADAAEISHLKMASADAGELALVDPVRIAWRPAAEVAPLRLRGGDTSLSIAWRGGGEGSFAVQAANLDSAWVAAWLPQPGPAWRVRSLQAQGRRSDRGVAFDATLRGQIRTAAQTAELVLAMRGDADGVELTRLDVTQGDQVLTRASGHLPLTWTDFPRPHWRFAQDEPLELHVDSSPASPLWPMLAAQAGVELSDAAAEAGLSGTLRRPEGELRVTVGRIRMADPGRAKLVPDLDDLTLVVRADRDGVTLQSLAGKLAGQKFDAAGRLPMDDARWSELWSSPRAFDWSRIEGHLELAGADIEPIAQHVAALPLAQGALDGRVEAHDGRFSGTLRLRHAISRPVGALGILQDIDADLAFTGRRLEVRKLAGRLGGEPVTLTGGVTWPAGGQPQLDLALKGSNLPLIRRPGLLLRGDLDLAARTTGDVTRITGTAGLRDGLVLADLATLLPSGRRGVARRPPYFSVEAAPFRDWQLGVEIRGDRAVRIRTAVFKGTASVHFDLSGTLGEPRAVGEATVDQAQVLFPFATFNVQLGVVRLRASDPYKPELVLNAVSHRHDYEVRLNVTGSPAQPSVAFSSNPPLDSSQVLLMVMTGQSPSDDPAARTGQQRLTQLGAYLGRGLFGDLGGENRLEIVAGEQTSQQGRETYEIEYKLDDKWSLTGEYDRFDDYNAGLKWRVYTQESEPDDGDAK